MVAVLGDEPKPNLLGGDMIRFHCTKQYSTGTGIRPQHQSPSPDLNKKQNKNKNENKILIQPTQQLNGPHLGRQSGAEEELRYFSTVLHPYF